MYCGGGYQHQHYLTIGKIPYYIHHPHYNPTNINTTMTDHPLNNSSLMTTTNATLTKTINTTMTTTKPQYPTNTTTTITTNMPPPPPITYHYLHSHNHNKIKWGVVIGTSVVPVTV
jgi:hypothetical protein